MEFILFILGVIVIGVIVFIPLCYIVLGIIAIKDFFIFKNKTSAKTIEYAVKHEKNFSKLIEQPLENLDKLIIDSRFRYRQQSFFENINANEMTDYQRTEKENELYSSYQFSESTHTKAELFVVDVKSSRLICCIYNYKNEEIKFDVEIDYRDESYRDESEVDIRNKNLLLKINKGDMLIIDGIFESSIGEWGDIYYSIKTRSIELKEKVIV